MRSITRYQKSDIIIGMCDFLKFSILAGLGVAGVVSLTMWLGLWAWLGCWLLMAIWWNIDNAKRGRERLESRRQNDLDRH